MRADAQNLLEQSRNAAANERTLAVHRAKEIREQADALLNQATRDAGRIMAEAEKRAEQIGGDAYVALRDKQTLEKFLAMQVNKMNARKEFFRVTLTEIHQEIEKLKQGDDFTVKVWTDKATATEYKESLDIETDPLKKEKWLARQKALADRQLRLDLLRIPVAEIAELNSENQEKDPF